MSKNSKNDLLLLWSRTTANRFFMASPLTIKYEDVECTVGEQHVLGYIAANPGKTSIELAKESHRSRGTISLLLKKMIEKGLLYFKDDPYHRKRKLIYLSSLGEKINELASENDTRYINSLLDMLESRYTPEEMQLIISALYDTIEFTAEKATPKSDSF